MVATLQPVFEALGYSGDQQTAMVKLLHAAGAYGQVPGTGEVLEDRQAIALLQNFTFDSPKQAAQWLHEMTQKHMLRPYGTQRADYAEPEKYKKHRSALLTAAEQAGLLADLKPMQAYYDHVLVLGAPEGATDQRLDRLLQAWNEGARFGKIHLLGSERKINATTGDDNEMAMMVSRYYDKSAHWPKDLQDVRIFEVATYRKPNGDEANTRDTAESWLKTNPEPGRVLVISSQPYNKYQDAAVKSVLPSNYQVETIGARAAPDVKIGLMMDAFARQIDVNYVKLLEAVKTQPEKSRSDIVMFDPAMIEVDAATYQFRSGGNAKGVTEKGRVTADKWDPVLHGDPLLVHERLDGRVFVADGHHRVDLAKELNAKGTGPGKVAAMVLREADGYTAQDVKIIAAYKNLSHGHTEVVDAARVFKEANSGKVNKLLLPQLQMDKGNLRMSFSISKLSDASINRVEKGEIPAEMAAKVAEQLPGDTAKQDNVIELISRKLHPEYGTQENAQASSVKVQINDLANTAEKLGGFVAKLKQQRLQFQPHQGLSC